MELLQSVKHKSTYFMRVHFYFFIKRLFDILMSGVLILLFSPPSIYIAYKIYKREGKPVIFKETYAGKNHRIFTMYTFRIKTPKRQLIKALPPYPFPSNWQQGVPDKFNFKRDGDTFYTVTGLKLKKYFLHHLPQLWNVLKGDMSFVGPKPERMEIASYYNRYQENRLKVRPGITGYAQINLMERSGYNDMIHHDIYYIEHFSPLLDIKVLCLSFLNSFLK
ncbi:MAG TPA: sugar transferase [Candidatus Avamphibacillus sp.]|nr:sugar transferase [Candidatus Avamphibacillus sp.]